MIIRSTNLILFYSLLILASCKTNGDKVKPQRKDLVQAVYASGKLFPQHHYTIFTKVAGYVQIVLVKPGDPVKIGQPLLSIRNEVSSLNTDIARNQLAFAKENANEKGNLLSALNQDVAKASTQYTLDSLNFERVSELHRQDATSRQTYDQSKTQKEISYQNYLKARDNFASFRTRLKIELLNAQNLFSAQQSAEKDYTILSSLNGKIYDVIPQAGDYVTPQQPLMEAGDSTIFEVELAVDETDISFLMAGQEIVYSIDAFPDQIFNGTVTEIYPKVNSGSKTSRVKGSMEGAAGLHLYSNMSVEANIIIREKKNALVIPKEYLKSGNTVIVNGKPIRIQKGIEDLQYVEIISGIDGSVELSK